MAKRNSSLLILRNQKIKKRYIEIDRSKKGKWKHTAILETLVMEFYLSQRTLTAILNDAGTYGQTA